MNNEKNCQNRREEIAALVLGEIEPKAAEKLKRHIDTCQNCKSLYQALTDEEETIRSAFKTITDKGEAVKSNLIEQLDKQGQLPKTTQLKFVKSPITKLAVAAAIIIAAILLLHNGPVDITSPAFGIDKVIEAMQKAEWIHCVMTLEQFSGDPNVTTMSIGDGWESWQSVNPVLSVEKHNDGKIYFTGTNTARTSCYDPQTNIITVTYRNPEASQEAYTNISDMCARGFNELKNQFEKVKYEEGILDGQSVTTISIDYTSEGGLNSIVSIIVDSESYLPIKLTWQQKHLKKGYGGKMMGIFEYPQSGPKDIYEAGAPQDAKIIYADNRDNLDLIEAIKPYNTARENLPSDYILITTYQYGSWIRSIDVIYNQGRKQRSEYRPVWKSVMSEEEMIAYNEALGDSFESLQKWLQDYGNSDGKNLGIYNYDGQYYYRAEKDPLDKWNISEKSHWPDHNPIGLNDLSDWGWPMIPPKNYFRQIENEYSKENSLIAFERILEPTVRGGKLVSAAQRDIYYLDPNHDYMCVRKEDFQRMIKGSIEMKDVDFDINQIPDELSSFRFVSEFGQTDSGQWYPKKIEQYSKNLDLNGNEKPIGLSTVFTLYLKTNPEFPEEIFDPNNLPKEK